MGAQLDFGLLILDPETHRRKQQMKERKCLCCTRMFLSTGPGNRVCLPCKDLDRWSSPATSYAVHAAF